jgi:hypothetical protein
LLLLLLLVLRLLAVPGQWQQQTCLPHWLCHQQQLSKEIISTAERQDIKQASEQQQQTRRTGG